MSATESDRILAPGVPITLTDGREVRVRYGMRALKMLEDEFGGLGAVEDVLDGNGKMIGPIVMMLAAGLSHEHISADELLDLTDPAELASYGDAVSAAFGQAFPQASQGNVEGNGASEGPSPGQTSTTSLPSVSDGLTTPSGP